MTFKIIGVIDIDFFPKFSIVAHDVRVSIPTGQFASADKIRGNGLNDFSALLLPGPLGAIVSHGYDQLEALEKMMAATGESTIKQVVSDWKVANSVFTAADVAFSTQRNRVAVKGSLDIPSKKLTV
jgi:hypothetical protein